MSNDLGIRFGVGRGRQAQIVTYAAFGTPLGLPEGMQVTRIEPLEGASAVAVTAKLIVPLEELATVFKLDGTILEATTFDDEPVVCLVYRANAAEDGRP